MIVTGYYLTDYVILLIHVY